MTDFAHVTFKNRAQRASIDLLMATGLQLTLMEVEGGQYCVALWAADAEELVDKWCTMLVHPNFKRLSRHIGPADIKPDDDGGWLLKFRLLVARCETVH